MKLKEKSTYTVLNNFQMSCCRNILELFHFFEDSTCFYLVFEKLRGGEKR